MIVATDLGAAAKCPVQVAAAVGAKLFCHDIKACAAAWIQHLLLAPSSQLIIMSVGIMLGLSKYVKAPSEVSQAPGNDSLFFVD